MYDAIIVGSGYAGSVLAARLAPHGKVLLVERGKWWKPGDFPESLPGIARTYMSRRNPLGLWAMRIGEGTGTAFASAFGGSSAVNYGITSRPDPHAFEGWPVSEAELASMFERALEVLRPTPNPEADDLGDKQFLDRLEPGARVDLQNTIDWEDCTQCGRCVPGCNLGAKRSLDRSYLALAMEAGLDLRLETEVVGFDRREEGGYDVALRPTGRGGRVEKVPTRRLVLAAGTFGTLDLLHAARAAFPLSPRFGQAMSMNGDGLAFLYNLSDRLSSHSGAPISTSVRLRFVDDDGRKRTLMAMSGRVPKAIMKFAATVMALGAGGLVDRGASPSRLSLGRLARAARRLRDLGPVGAGGAWSHSFMYKLDGQDGDRGTARFVDGRAVIDWPDYLDDPISRFAEATLNDWAERAGGRVVPNVARLPLPGMRSFSVHPLGGCRMGDDVEGGVVDTYGRVFDPAGGVYPGLRVVDGSIIPGSLGVPPSLTITALAERAAEDLRAEFAAAA